MIGKDPFCLFDGILARIPVFGIGADLVGNAALHGIPHVFAGVLLGQVVPAGPDCIDSAQRQGLIVNIHAH